MIDYWFPIGIYTTFYNQHESVKLALQNFVNKQSVQQSDTTTWPFWKKNLDNYVDVLKINDQTIKKLVTWIEEETNSFSKHFNSTNNYKITQGWINSYYRGDFQEPHLHLGFDFSAIYYLNTPPGSGSLIFENPCLAHEMRPIKTFQETVLNSTSVGYKPIEGQLLIFRSNLRHGVTPHQNDNPRVSLAFNLISE